MLGTILLIVSLGIAVYTVVSRALSRAPPGPIGVPGLGYLPVIAWRSATDSRHRLFLSMEKLRRRFGDVASFRMGTQEFVLISGFEALREAFVTNPDKFPNRSNTNLFKFLFKSSGIAGSDGALWLEHRRFALRVLKEFGLGRNASELQIQEEAAQVVAFLRQKDGQQVNTKSITSKSVANVISRFIYSDYSSYEDPEFNEFIQRLVSITNQGLAGLLTVFYRSVSVETALRLSPSVKKHFDAVNWTEEVSRRKVEAIRSKYSVTDEPSNYVEAYLQEQQKRGMNLGTFTDFQLVKTIWELFIGGLDTTSNSLRWCLVYSALNPELQDRCYAEIMAKIGKRQVTLMDKKELNYCQAFLDEAQRISTLAPMSVEHRAAQDTEFRGFRISSDAVILTNLYGLHHDEKLFPEPNRFNPDRFLTPEGQYKQSEFLYQFGIGKRSCIGEVLARMELFLFFVTFLQHFRFLPDKWTPEQQEQILLGSEGMVHAPGDHLLVVSNRDSG